MREPAFKNGVKAGDLAIIVRGKGLGTSVRVDRAIPAGMTFTTPHGKNARNMSGSEQLLIIGNINATCHDEHALPQYLKGFALIHHSNLMSLTPSTDELFFLNVEMQSDAHNDRLTRRGKK